MPHSSNRNCRWSWTRTAEALACASLSLIAIGIIYAFELQVETRLHTSELAEVRGRLENVVSDAIAPTTALRSVVIAERGSPPPHEFQPFAESLHDDAPHLLAAQLAPDGIVLMSSKLERNAKAIGHDLFADPARRDEAMRTIRQKRTVLTGPVDLIQGGQALIARRPIFLDGVVSRTGIENFYGFATAIIDAGPLFEAAEGHWDDMALKGRHGLGEDGDLIFGTPGIFDGDPLRMEVTLPNGTWVLAHRRPTIQDFRHVILTWAIVFCLVSAYVLHVREKNRNIEEKAAWESARLRLATRIGDLGFIDIDDDGSARPSNGARRILGISEEAPLPLEVQQAVSRYRIAAGAGTEANAIETTELELQDDGNQRVIELIPRVDEGGRCLVAVRDITNAASRRSREMHVAKLVSIGELAAGIAHELNTPLQFISNNLGYLRSFIVDLTKSVDEADGGRETRTLPADCVDELLTEVPEAVGDCIVGTERMAQIVAAMKSYASPSAGESEQTINLDDAIGQAVALTTGAHKHVATIGFTPSDSPVIVAGELGEMTQIFINLINNACDAIVERQNAEDGSRSFGQIDIGVQKKGARYEVSISDNGVGVPPEMRDRVFDLFFTTKPVGKGTGQGLAITSAILERRGGAIACRANMPTGCVFTLDLPCAQDKPAEADQRAFA